MIIKEWSNEELGKNGYTSFNDKILSKFYGADISREKQYRWAMAHKAYFAIDNEQPINNVNGGHGELFGYPIVIDNSVEGILFEEYSNS